MPTTKKPAPAKKAPAGKKAARKPAQPKKEQQPAVLGRPSAYRAEFAEQAYKLCLLGATDAKMADFFGVSEKTLNEWKKAHPEFLQSMVSGKDEADAEIAKALFHRAKGYSHPEDDIRTVAMGGKSEIVITPTVKHYPPDTQAASLWLRNRQPKLWRDKVEHELTGKDGGPIESHNVHELSTEALVAIASGKA